MPVFASGDPPPLPFEIYVAATPSLHLPSHFSPPIIHTYFNSKSMSTCPVCDQVVDADQVAFEHHVNAHFDEGSHDPQLQQRSDDQDIEFIGQR